ncbi:hypothetical protein [Jiella sonneratiae]|uniref:Secreted protein n=1 Tax=Jiella sonneratiae TaxID=2816856 RepID=A0ABS3J011_9HYPH|nr:hypothetical protein [Jiella sonneratiae]MBO0903014.1 hypothetical protein [Jiella sonneratiae]
MTRIGRTSGKHAATKAGRGGAVSWRGAAAALLLAAGGGLAGSPAAAAGTDSAYTKLDLDGCTVLQEYEDGGGVDLECAGYKGIPVFVSEGDLRVDVDFGEKNDDFSSFSPFNEPGETIEWRLSGGKPFAAILRFHLDPGDGSGKITDVLAVHTIAGEGRASCPVGYVDASANADANVLARAVADEVARRFACGSDKPRYRGKVSELGGTATAAQK